MADIEDDLKKIPFIGGSLDLGKIGKNLKSAMARGVNAIITELTEPNKEVQP